MRRVIVLLMLLAATFIVAPVAPANASTPCISRSEYRSIHRGMPRAQVTRMAGYFGRIAEGGARSYRGCHHARRVLVFYRHTGSPLVTGKARVNLLANDPLAG